MNKQISTVNSSAADIAYFLLEVFYFKPWRSALNFFIETGLLTILYLAQPSLELGFRTLPLTPWCRSAVT